MNYKLITFDVYSALMDIEGSIAPELGSRLNLDEASSHSLFRVWRTAQWNYLLLNNSMNNGFLSYKYITKCTLEYALQKLGAVLSESEKDELVSCWIRLKPWPGVKDVLTEVRNRGYKIAILSNGDEDMLQDMAEYCEIPFDYIFSADQAGAYKPSPHIYELPFKRLGLKREEVLHVAGSSFDTMGAVAAGMVVAWSNRFKDYTLDSRCQPAYCLNSLEELPDIL